MGCGLMNNPKEEDKTITIPQKISVETPDILKLDTNKSNIQKKKEREKLLISACLMGKNVKYNGKNNLIELSHLQKRYELIPFCPEEAGGLSTPRPPSEIVSTSPLQLINNQNVDVTKEFIKGAKETLYLAKKEGIKKALLKANSPSCSSSFVYDGSFSGKLVAKEGVTTMLLRKNGIEVFDEKLK